MQRDLIAGLPSSGGLGGTLRPVGVEGFTVNNGRGGRQYWSVFHYRTPDRRNANKVLCPIVWDILWEQFWCDCSETRFAALSEWRVSVPPPLHHGKTETPDSSGVSYLLVKFPGSALVFPA